MNKQKTAGSIASIGSNIVTNASVTSSYESHVFEVEFIKNCNASICALKIKNLFLLCLIGL